MIGDTSYHRYNKTTNQQHKNLKKKSFDTYLEALIYQGDRGQMSRQMDLPCTYFIKNWKTSAVSTTDCMVETQLCKLRSTPYIRHVLWTFLFRISFIIWCLWTKPKIWFAPIYIHMYFLGIYVLWYIAWHVIRKYELDTGTSRLYQYYLYYIYIRKELLK